MEMNAVGAVSRAGEKCSVLFCRYTGSSKEKSLINAFLNGLDIAIDRESIYCLAVQCKDDTVNNIVGIYYRKDGVNCMVYDKPYEYLTDYVMEIFSEEKKDILTEGEETHDSKTNQ